MHQCCATAWHLFEVDQANPDGSNEQIIDPANGNIYLNLTTPSSSLMCSSSNPSDPLKTFTVDGQLVQERVGTCPVTVGSGLIYSGRDHCGFGQPGSASEPEEWDTVTTVWIAA